MTIVRPLFIGLAVFALPHLVQAQNVFVTAGEHKGFTRIFLDSPPGTEWALDVAENALEFSTTGTATGFNLSRAYERISDQRVRRFSPISENTLRIDLACDCQADATDWGKGDVVIDIHDRKDEHEDLGQPKHGDVPAGYAYDWTQNLVFQMTDKTAPQPPAAPEIPAEHTAPLFGDPPPAIRLTDAARSTISKTTAIDTLGMFPETPAGFQHTSIAFPEMARRDTSMDVPADFQNALLRQLQRAASQGVINISKPNVDLPLEPILDTEHMRTTQDSRPGKTEPAQPAVSVPMQQMVVTTAQDAALPKAEGGPVPDRQSSGCLPREWFDPQYWATSKVAPGLSGLRADLVGEFDRPNIENVIKLAHYYLYLGFGLEARELIKTFSVSAENSAIIDQISRILDGDEITDPSALTSQIGCSPATTLWALIAEPDQVFNPDLDVAAVLAAFSAFPVQLRNLIGPTLAENFSRAGNRDAAIAIRNVADRSGEADTEGLKMINAEIDIADGNIDGASLELNSVISEDQSRAAEAMIKLISERKRAGLSVGPDVASAADALAVEYRGTKLGRQLTEAAIRAFSISGQPQITFDRIHAAQARNAIDAATIQNLIDQAFLDAVQNADDVTFLRLIHKEDLPEIDEQESRQLQQDAVTRISVATRLIDLAFYKRASEILAPLRLNPSPDVQFLFARIAFGTDRFDDVLAWLEGRDDQPAQELRANTLFQMGEYTTAATIFGQTGEKDRAIHAAWISGDFERAARLDTGQLGQLVALSQNDTPQTESATDVEKPLEAWRKATQQSRNLRDIIRQVLD